MITRIKIENFRCFQNTELKDFKMVNLIGGKNNVGKTALLEAIFVGLEPYSLRDLIENRLSKQNDKNNIENLFFGRNTNKNISISPQIQINIDNQINYDTYNLIFTFNGIYDGENIANKFSLFSANENEFRIRRHLEYNISLSFILSKHEQYPTKINLAEEIDKIDREGKIENVIKALQLIDSSIEQIRTFSTDVGVVFVRKKGEIKHFPIEYLGDALQKIIRYIITIINFDNTKDNYLLLDEVENGLHYSVQEEFWNYLFILAKAYNVQIFATTHSKDCVTAFSKIVNKEEYKDFGLFMRLDKVKGEIREVEFNSEELEIATNQNIEIR